MLRGLGEGNTNEDRTYNASNVTHDTYVDGIKDLDRVIGVM